MASIENLFRTRHVFFLRLLTRRLGDTDEAEEVLQDAYIQFQKAYSATDVEHPEALLIKIAFNLAIDHIRRNASRRKREDSWCEVQTAVPLEGDLLADMPSQDRQVDAKIELERVITQLQLLSVQVRTAFILHKFHGLTHRETAARMGIAQSTVEKHIMKAFKSLIEAQIR